MVHGISLFEEELPKYLSEVKAKHAENAKAFAFSSFIQKIFDIKSEDVDLEIPVKSEVMKLRGRIDAVFGNLIIEFKKDLKKTREDAESELMKYFQAYHEKYSEVNYLGMASDGVQFIVYKPTYENNQVTGVKEEDKINLDLSNPQDIFRWFDSYLFSSPKTIPTSADIKRRFGIDSPTFSASKSQLFALYDMTGNKESVRIKFNSWAKYLEIVYGDQQKEIDLFIKHTYLSTLVKLIVHLRLSGGKIIPKKDMSQILHGYFFHGYGILNFVEADFFTWITHPSTKSISDEFTYKLLNQLRVYDLEKIDEDILKELYQELIDPEYRKLLGEFYTPDWLAQKTVQEILKEKPEASLLDPSCGSGTFLFTAIRYKIKHLEKIYDESELLNHILKTVRGFDVHPLAVTIAKTNYLLALRTLINHKKTAIEIPVYLSDSVKLPSRKFSLQDNKDVYEIQATDNKSFMIPAELASDSKVMDDVINKMYNHSSNYSDSRIRYLEIAEKSKSSMNDSIERAKENFFKGFQNSLHNIKNNDTKSVLINNYRTLISLIDEDKDSIWTYIIKNIYKPIALSNLKVDVIVGNPPWIAMQNMKNELYQRFLKEETFRYGLIDKNETHQFPHLDLATLFFCLVVDLYLRENGKIGFVMPRSILVSSHHEKFRKFLKPTTKLEKILDVENVSPLFNIPSCVIICVKGETTSYPVPVEQLSGRLKRKNASLDEAMTTLTTKEIKFEPNSLLTQASDYFDKFYQGATIVPRNFYFVTVVKDPFLGINPTSPKVKSDPRNATKPPWSDTLIEEEIESNFLFGTLLGDDIVPFGYRGIRMVALPIFLSDGKPRICKNSSEFQENGFTHATNFFQTAETFWNKYSTDKSKKMTPYQRLNFRKGIERQDLNNRYKVLYVASSTYLASCIIDVSEKMFYSIDELKIPLAGFIAESKTYWYETNDVGEAHYLCSILNSKIIDDLIKPMQTHGLWGERDIHKRPLELPIPKFSKSNPDHKKLSELGKICHDRISTILDTINSSAIGRIRSQIRTELKEEFDTISSLTKKILIENDRSIESYL